MGIAIQKGNHAPGTINPENYNSGRLGFYVKNMPTKHEGSEGCSEFAFFDSKAVDSSGQFSVKSSGHLTFPCSVMVCFSPWPMSGMLYLS